MRDQSRLWPRSQKTQESVAKEDHGQGVKRTQESVAKETMTRGVYGRPICVVYGTKGLAVKAENARAILEF